MYISSKTLKKRELTIQIGLLDMSIRTLLTWLRANEPTHAEFDVRLRDYRNKCNKKLDLENRLDRLNSTSTALSNRMTVQSYRIPLNLNK